MGREIEFSATKIGTNSAIESYKYIRTDQVRVRAMVSNATIGEKSIYNIALALGNGTEAVLNIKYPIDGVKSSVIESLKTAKDSVITVANFLELLSSKMDSVEIINNDMVIRGHKKALASEVSLVYHFKDLALEF
jgi:hypothetical protein